METIEAKKEELIKKIIEFEEFLKTIGIENDNFSINIHQVPLEFFTGKSVQRTRNDIDDKPKDYYLTEKLFGESYTSCHIFSKDLTSDYSEEIKIDEPIENL